MKSPKVEEFRLFAELLMQSAPPEYVPWFFRCGAGSKAPELKFGSWKHPSNRMPARQATQWLERGGNVGIAAMQSDPLVNMDCDGNVVKKEELIPTLMSRTRSRIGIHAFNFDEDYVVNKIPNIPTDSMGEVRSQNQYVIAPGSYVLTDPLEVPPEERENAGYYTVIEKRPPAWITYADIPEIFRKVHEKRSILPPKTKTEAKKAAGPHSALFDITAADVVLREGGSLQPNDRWSSIFHDSTTESNMSISTKGLLHCWRHNVSHNGLQALAVLSGYMSCLDAGTPHSGAGGGSSAVSGDDGAIFHAWLYAKTHGYIPISDPIPVRAMAYIARKHKVYNLKDGEMLPKRVYNQVLEIVDEEY